jgi:Peptidase C39 family
VGFGCLFYTAEGQFFADTTMRLFESSICILQVDDVTRVFRSHEFPIPSILSVPMLLSYRFLCSIMLLALFSNASGATSEETMKSDCGVNALFVLFELEGRQVTFDRLERALPARHPDGYSMAELAAASRTLGLRLEGVRFASGDKALNRPAIAFLNDAKGGHFAVLCPVGTTGTMVQVIDSPSAHWIGDYDRVLTARPWTGRILVRRDVWVVRNVIPLLSALAGCMLLVAAFTIWRRTARVQRSEEYDTSRGSRCGQT